MRSGVEQDPPIPYAFPREHASRLVGLSQELLRGWDQSGLYSPRYGSGLYDFSDLVALRTLAILRNDRGIPTKNLRKIGEWLSENHEAPWSRLRFFTEGREVMFRAPASELIISTKPGGQLVGVPLPLRPVVDTLRRDAARLLKRPSELIGKVEKRRGFQSGQACIAGTRIPTATVYAYHRAGESIADIKSHYPSLETADVEAAIEYERDQRGAA